MLKKGQVLNNRYQIHAVLGEGGFGAVYKVWDDNLQRHCAIKENLQVGAESQKQFRREALMLANLNHPNLVRVTDYFIIPDQGQYLVMDYVDGNDLETILRNNGGPLPTKQALAWIGQVCDALIYIHNQNPPIIHRDIKPANVRVTLQGNAVLVDFGLAKNFGDGVKTLVGARGLTPHFAAPEQYGSGGTDAQSDIYSLGVTLYCLLTYSLPPDSVEILVGNATSPLSAKAVNRNIPDSISDALQRAMQIRRIERYKSVSDFKNALEGRERLEIRDFRLSTHMLSKLEQSILIWAEGSDRAKGRSRYELHQANEFAIYTTPPSMSELRAALEIVKPKMVYLFGVSPRFEKADAFLQRLAGFAKYAINQKSGKGTVRELAAATSQREGAIRIGLEWLAAGGHISLQQDDETVLLSAGNGKMKQDLQRELYMAVKGILEETATYRRFFETTQDLQELLNLEVEQPSN